MGAALRYVPVTAPPSTLMTVPLTNDAALAARVKAKVLEIQKAKAGLVGGEAVPDEDEDEAPELEAVEVPKEKKKKKE